MIYWHTQNSSGTMINEKSIIDIGDMDTDCTYNAPIVRERHKCGTNFHGNGSLLRSGPYILASVEKSPRFEKYSFSTNV